MRSHAHLVGLVAFAAAFAAGCALSHEAAIDTGLDDAHLEFDVSVIDGPRRDVSSREIVARPDVIDPPDSGCAAGTTSCGAAGCVDVSNDTSNCGACATTCSAPTNGSPVCSAGVCHVNCATGYHLCGAACVIDSSTTQCGPGCMPCQSVPNADVTCVGGACAHTCIAGYMDNGGGCVPVGPMTCGDRMLQTGESCDDGNRAAGDGCSPACQMEPGTSAEDCSSGITAIRIADSGTHFYTGTTNGAVSDSSGSGTCTGNGPDVAFQIVYSPPLSSYTYTVTATPSTHWDLVLQHGGACPTGSCVDMHYAGTAEAYSFSPTTSATTYVMIDGWSTADHGDFVLQIDVR